MRLVSQPSFIDWLNIESRMKIPETSWTYQKFQFYHYAFTRALAYMIENVYSEELIIGRNKIRTIDRILKLISLKKYENTNIHTG